jgi:class I fructose-bisphosphate aldolase
MIERLVDAGADAIMTTYGTSKQFQAHLKGKGLIVRIDSGDQQTYSVEDALRIGADSVITMGWVHEDLERNRHLRYLAEVASCCDRWGVPFLAEMQPFEHIPFFSDPNNPPKQQLVDAVARVCRMGAELGADYIKSMYTGSTDTFRYVVGETFIPVLILGGKFREGGTRQVLTQVWECIQAGGRGVVMGRNVWSHPHPERVVDALNTIVHKGGSVEQAVKAIE